MAISVLLLVALAVVGLLVLGGIAIAGLAHKQTRPITLVLLAVPAGLVVALLLEYSGMRWFGSLRMLPWANVVWPAILLLVLAGIVKLLLSPSGERGRPLGFAMVAVVVLAVPIVLAGFLFGLYVWTTARIYVAEEVVAEEVVAGVERSEPPDTRTREVASLHPETSSETKPGTQESSRIIRALGWALGRAISRQRVEQDAAKDAAGEPTSTKTVGPEPKTAPTDQPEAVKAAKLEKMMAVLSRAVADELPEDLDEFTVLRALGRVLGRAIADEQEKLAARQGFGRASNETVPGETGPVETGPDRRPAIDARPAWVDAPSGKVGEVYRIVTVVGPYTTELECERALPKELRSEVDQYAELYLGPDAAAKLSLSDALLHGLVKATWKEDYQSTVGPMVRLHAMLQLDAKANTRLKEAYREAEIVGRLWYTGGGLLAVLAVLSTAFGYLKTDLATNGRYRGRLRLATSLIVAVLVAAGVCYFVYM